MDILQDQAFGEDLRKFCTWHAYLGALVAGKHGGAALVGIGQAFPFKSSRTEWRRQTARRGAATETALFGTGAETCFGAKTLAEGNAPLTWVFEAESRVDVGGRRQGKMFLANSVGQREDKFSTA